MEYWTNINNPKGYNMKNTKLKKSKDYIFLIGHITIFVLSVFAFIMCVLDESWFQAALSISLTSIVKPFLGRQARKVFNSD